MTERITEAELADVERALVPSLSYAKGVTEGEANLARGVQRYIAEVRRLRGLIADWHSPEHDERRLWPALEDEARAIREEGVIGPIPVMLGSPEPQVQWAGIPKDAAGVKRVWINGKPFVREKP